MTQLFIVSGHSGAGKTSVMRKVLGSKNEIVSVTTRAMRSGEIDGVDYHFISKEDFLNLRSKKSLIEETYYDGNHYGLVKEHVDLKLEKGSAYAIVDFTGMRMLKKIYPDAVTVFLYCSKEQLVKRLANRGDSSKNIMNRVDIYEEAMHSRLHYDYVIRNEGTESNIENILSLIVKNEEISEGSPSC